MHLEYLLIVILVFSAGNVFAKSKEETVIIGPFVSGSATTIKDDDGNVGKSYTVPRIGLTANYLLDSKSELSFDVAYHSDSYAVSTTEIGQKVKGYGLNVEYLNKLSIWYDYKLWIGGGATFNSLKYTDRYLISSNGFLSKRFEDQKKQEFGVILTAEIISEDRSRSYKYLFGASYEYPIDTGINGLFISLGVLF